MSLHNKHIILGLTGGIAAYKSAPLARRLIDAGAEVKVVMTAAAKEFITPLTMQAVSGNPVHHDLLDPNAEAAMGHIELARWADLILIAPASADFIARLAYGHANDLLSTLCLATKARIAVVPAMNQQMWQAPQTKANIERLIDYNVAIIGPGQGVQACGDVGWGRMLEPEDIVQAMQQLMQSQNNLLKGQKVLMTAGPTREAIDPVRYLSNHSSGKMGYALAQAASDAGAEVTLISGPCNLLPPAGVNTIPVTSAQEMYDQVMQHLSGQDIFIGAAAVADYRCQEVAGRKIKKQNATLELKLTRNPDILSEVAKSKLVPMVVGFAAETDDVINQAKLKLTNKGLDMIIANHVGVIGQGFDADTNACTVITKTETMELPLQAKQALAIKLMTLIAKQKHEKHTSQNLKSKT